MSGVISGGLGQQVAPATAALATLHRPRPPPATGKTHCQPRAALNSCGQNSTNAVHRCGATVSALTEKVLPYGGRLVSRAERWFFLVLNYRGQIMKRLLLTGAALLSLMTAASAADLA